MAIKFDTPESQATGSTSSTHQLIRSVVQYVSARDVFVTTPAAGVSSMGLSASSSSLLGIAELLQEYFYETAALLRKYPLEEHQILWTWNLNNLAQQLVKLKGSNAAYGNNNQTSRRLLDLRNLDPNFRELDSRLSRLTSDLVHMTRSFYQGFVVEKATQLNQSLALCCFQQLAELTGGSLKLVGCDEHTPLVENTSLQSVTLFLQQLYRSNNDELAKTIFPSLVDLIKVAYWADDFSLVEELLNLGVVSATTPLEMIHTSKMDYIVLVDFYRYTGFLLVSQSLKSRPEKDLGRLSKLSVDSNHGSALDLQPQTENHINSSSAVPYFKVLLRLPNLNISLWTPQEGKKLSSGSLGGTEVSSSSSGPLEPLLEDKVASHSVPAGVMKQHQPYHQSLLSLEDRQEISLLYVISYLQNLKSLRGLVHPEKIFRQELDFLTKTLTSSMSADIHRSVSVSSSSVSLTQMERDASASVNLAALTSSGNENLTSVPIKYRSISSILYHGTYKEKLHMVMQLLAQLSLPGVSSIRQIVSQFTPGVSSDSDFSRLAATIDPTKYPGKIAFVRAVEDTSLLLQSLAIKHWISSSGINNIPESVFARKFGWSKDQILSNAHIHRWFHVQECLDSEESALKFTPTVPEVVDLDQEIMEQLAIHKRTQALNEVALRLR